MDLGCSTVIRLAFGGSDLGQPLALVQTRLFCLCDLVSCFVFEPLSNCVVFYPVFLLAQAAETIAVAAAQLLGGMPDQQREAEAFVETELANHDTGLCTQLILRLKRAVDVNDGGVWVSDDFVSVFMLSVGSHADFGTMRAFSGAPVGFHGNEREVYLAFVVCWVAG